MKIRILFGLPMILALAGILWLDWRVGQYTIESRIGVFSHSYHLFLGWPVGLLIAILTVFAHREMAKLAAACGVGLLGWTTLLGTIVLAVSPLLSRIAFWQEWPRLRALLDGYALLPLLLIAAFAEQMIRFRTEDALRRVAASILVLLYLGVCFSIVLSIRVAYGVETLVLFLATVKCTDIGAYFTGSAIGRHKMIPWLSPGKSWEGLAGGLVAAAGVGMLIVWGFKIDSLSLAQGALFGAVVGLAGQFGDLCESLLKRSAGAKDSGAVVPEFGGLLDIVDSPLLAAPVASILLSIMVRAGA